MQILRCLQDLKSERIFEYYQQHLAHLSVVSDLPQVSCALAALIKAPSSHLLSHNSCDTTVCHSTRLVITGSVMHLSLDLCHYWLVNYIRLYRQG